MIEGRVEIRDHQDDRDAPRARLGKALKALRTAGDRITELEKALNEALSTMGNPALMPYATIEASSIRARLLKVANAHPLAWQDDPEIDWTGIAR